MAQGTKAGNDLTVDLYAADGGTLLLRHVAVDGSGHFQATLGNYAGVVFARLGYCSSTPYSSAASSTVPSWSCA